MIHATRQRLEAGALAMDHIMAVFNTWDFKNTLLATNLPPAAPPAGSFLPSNSEIRTMIAPAPGALPPCQWEVEVRVVWYQAQAGTIRAARANDALLRVTRYDIERN